MRSIVVPSVLILLAVASGCAQHAARPRSATRPSEPSREAVGAPRSGPIRAVGYPAPIRMGANDPAHHVGFTADGELFGGCHTDGGLGALHCAFVDRAGAWHRQTNAGEVERGLHDGPEGRAIGAWIAARGVPAVVEAGAATAGPPLVGEWRYAGDLALHIASRPGELDGAGRVVRQPALLVGGRVGEELPVHPYVVTTDQGVGTEMELYGVVPNGVALSPDGRELGVLAHWYGMEFAGDFAVLRVRVDAFAARVYAATAERLRGRGDRAGALRMMEKARRADPTTAVVE